VDARLRRLDRLTSASKTGLSQTWSYDANGNRVTQGGTSSSTYVTSTTSNRLSSVSGALSRTYGYDAAGNTTGYGALAFTYNDAGRMTAVSGGASATYASNALGQRVKEATGGATTYFVYDEAGHLIGEYDGSGVVVEETVWMDDIPVAVLKPNGAGGVDLFYVHSDHLNAPRRISRPADNVILWRWDSDPFGTSTANEDPDGDMTAFTYNVRFPGQYFDAETGLSYNYFRDYDPQLGRYVQPDPIGLDGGLNPYLYANGNPLSFVDPTGLAVGDWWDFPANLRRAEQIGLQELAKRPSAHNDIEDARRHSEWMRRTTIETNSCTAWIAGTGHELEEILHWRARDREPFDELMMDLHNNAVGRGAGRNASPVDSSKLWTLPLKGSPINPYRGAY